MSETYFTYKGRPVVRKGRQIFYGSMANPYVVSLEVTEEQPDRGIQAASKVRCRLMKTDKNLNPMEAIVKNAERDSLYDALQLAAAWLEQKS